MKRQTQPSDRMVFCTRIYVQDDDDKGGQPDNMLFNPVLRAVNELLRLHVKKKSGKNVPAAVLQKNTSIQNDLYMFCNLFCKTYTRLCSKILFV